MVLTDESEIDNFIHKNKYVAIINALTDNLPDIKVTSEVITIKKNDLIFQLGPKEIPKLMKFMFQINNFICNEYRKRKRILDSTKRLGDE